MPVLSSQMWKVYARNALTIALYAFLSGAGVYQTTRSLNGSWLAAGIAAATGLQHLLTTAPKDSTQNPTSPVNILQETLQVQAKEVKP